MVKNKVKEIYMGYVIIGILFVGYLVVATDITITPPTTTTVSETSAPQGDGGVPLDPNGVPDTIKCH